MLELGLELSKGLWLGTPTKVMVKVRVRVILGIWLVCKCLCSRNQPKG